MSRTLLEYHFLVNGIIYIYKFCQILHLFLRLFLIKQVAIKATSKFEPGLRIAPEF